MAFKKALVQAGRGGWGSPLTIAPTDNQKIVCITGGSISPVAEKLGEITGAPVVDGFHHPVSDADTACAVVDCGGVSRAGVLSRKGILTVNINGGSPAGPMARFMKEGIYITGVTPENITVVEE